MKLLDTTTDAELSKIETLRWLPWIGASFLNLPRDEKLVIVGESHYFKSAEGQSEIDTYYPEYTRRVVEESLIRKEWTTRTLTNLTSLLNLETLEERESFWQRTVYYNFIQSSMDYSHKERPSDEQNEIAWKNFLELKHAFDPKYFLFIGVEAFNSFTACMEKYEIAHSYHWKEKISGTYLREASIGDAKLVGIKHLGSINSWPTWRETVKENYIPII